MSNNCKYYKQQKQFSTNSGETWSNVTPYEYRRGSLIESDSPDCQEEIKITRFVTIPDAFLCDGKDKYEKQVAQYSLDNGATWQYYYPSIFQLGNLVEANADICDNKWEGYYSGDTANICSNGYTYVAGRGCVKNGGSSNPCRDGYRYSTVAEKCAKVDPVKYVRCSSTTSTTLTRDDVNYPPYRVYAGLIGDSVTSIGTSAFTSCSGLTDIIIPNSVTSIGASAFRYCSSLTSITIPDSVTSIDNYTFSDCYNLVNTTIGSGVTSIGNNAFSYCYHLSSVTIGNSVTSIGDSAFVYCSGLTSITCLAPTPPTLGSSVFDNTNDCLIMVPCSSILSYQSEWGDYAFRIVGIPPCEDPQPTGATKLYATYNTGSIEFKYCDSTSAVTQNEITSNSALTSVVIGDCVTEIDDYAFSYCSGLTSVTIGNSVTNIGYRAFDACRSLTSVVIPNSMTSIETQAFAGCTSLSSVTIPNSVTSIGDSAFDSCGLISVSIPNSITELSSWIFYHCASLTSVTIPNSVTSIGQAAFAGCTSLSSVTIGNSVSTINQYVFNGCTNLTTITTYATTPPFLFGGALDGTNISTIYVPCGTLSAYQSDKGWSAYTSSMVELACPEYRWYPSGYTCNGLDKYQNNIKQESYDNGTTWANVVPNEFSASTLIEIDSEDCGYVPPSNRKWTATYSGGSVSMAACGASSVITNGEIRKSNLISVEISDCVTEIGREAFQYCRSLTSVTIPNSVTSIGASAFGSCSGLTSINIPDSVNYIGILAFGGCWGLTSVIIGSGITTLDNYAFEHCDGLNSITIHATTPPTLGWDVFSNTNNCPIYVPCGCVTAYKAYWSQYSSRITEIPDSCYKYLATYSGGTTSSAACDTNNNVIESGDVVTNDLTSVVIGDCVIEIGDYAFYNCSALTSVTCIANLPAALPPSIGTDVFGGTTPNNMVIYVPYLSEDDYKLSMPEYASRIQGIPETKWVGTYLDSHKEARACDGSLEIGRGDVNKSNLLTLKIVDCVTSIGTSAFTKCNSLTSVTIPDSVTSIGQHAFEQCMGLTKITIPAASIGADAFRLCYSLTSVTIGNSVASIGGATFEWCSGLTSVTIGSGVTSIGRNAFSNCKSLTSIIILATTPPTLGNTGVFYNTSANLVIYVPASSVSAYQSATNWSSLASRIQPIIPST